MTLSHALRGRTRYPGIVNSRISSFLPSYVSGLIGWWDASKITGLSDGDAISQWDDLSVKDNHLVQATANYKPLYKTNILNGLPCVRFDGIDDALRTTGVMNMRSGFVVSRYGASGNYPNYKGLLGHVVTGTIDIMLMNSGNTMLYANNQAYNNCWRNGSKTNDTAPIDSWQTLAFVTSNANNSYFMAVGEDDNRNAARFWLGDIAEIGIYNTTITTTDRENIELYLKNKYGHY
jgi:hypothetical protein